VVALRWSLLRTGAVGQPRLFRSAPGGGWEPVEAPESVKDAAASVSGVLAVRTGNLDTVDGVLTLVDAGARQSIADRVLEMAWSS
jgi:hypothetical protein